MVDIAKFLSEYIKPDEVNPEERVLILDEGELVQGEFGLQLTMGVKYLEQDRKFTMNKTNSRKFVEILGKDTKKWVGHSFFMKVKKVMVGTKEKDSIEVMPIELE